jgi:hypothetical protein
LELYKGRCKEGVGLYKNRLARLGNGTKVFYCNLVTSDSCTTANVTKSWYCPILQTVRPNSCNINPRRRKK